jgi:hypothetical protein
MDRFYQRQADNTEEARTIFCNPTMELFYIKAAADLSSGALTSVNIVNNYTASNSVTGPPLNNVPYNACVRPGVGIPVLTSSICRVIFEPSPDPFVQARANGTKVGVPGAIFRSALQQPNGLQSVFDLPNGFTDLTNTVYVSLCSLPTRTFSLNHIIDPASRDHR